MGVHPESQYAKERRETDVLKDRAYKLYFGKDRLPDKPVWSPARVLSAALVNAANASGRRTPVVRKARQTCYCG